MCDTMSECGAESPLAPTVCQQQPVHSAQEQTSNTSRWTLKRNVSFTDNGNSAVPSHKRSRSTDNKDSWDVHHTMETMDRRYGTKFVEWIQSEENLDCAAAHLRKIAKEYDVKKVANGLRWMVSNWTIDNIATLLRQVTADWQVAHAANLGSLVSNDWPLKPFTSRLVLCIAHDMTDEGAVEYIAAFTAQWSVDSTLELVADLAEKLSWRPDQARNFALMFTWALRAHRTLDQYELARLQLFCFSMPAQQATALTHHSPLHEHSEQQPPQYVHTNAAAPDFVHHSNFNPHQPSYPAATNTPVNNSYNSDNFGVHRHTDNLPATTSTHHQHVPHTTSATLYRRLSSANLATATTAHNRRRSMIRSPTPPPESSAATGAGSMSCDSFFPDPYRPQHQPEQCTQGEPQQQHSQFNGGDAYAMAIDMDTAMMQSVPALEALQTDMRSIQEVVAGCVENENTRTPSATSCSWHMSSDCE